MPIRRGSQKIIKRYRGSQEILTTYRGTQKVYSSVPPVVPFELSGTIPSGSVPRSAYINVAYSPTFRESGVFRVEFFLDWTVPNATAQRITYEGYTISGPNEFGLNPISRDHTLRYPPYQITFQAFSNHSNSGQRSYAGGWWKITRIGM